MTDKTTDSTQPESTAQTEGLTVVKPGDRSHIQLEEVDVTIPPFQILPESCRESSKMRCIKKVSGPEMRGDITETTRNGSTRT